MHAYGLGGRCMPVLSASACLPATSLPLACHLPVVCPASACFFTRARHAAHETRCLGIQPLGAPSTLTGVPRARRHACVRVQPHPLWERVGHDLWYRVPADVPPLPVASSVYFTLGAPTLEGVTKKWVGSVIKTVGVTKQATACGHCLDACLGYDRSGFAEGVVKGKGMPL